jgi:phosphoribosyl-ATP pyrophosphohydrolase
MTAPTKEETILERLFAVIDGRRGADPGTSYTARLLRAGKEDCARKVGEEAIETVMATLRGNRHDVVHESADLLFHLLVLWSCAGIRPEEVWQELERREGTSGLAEKAARGENTR